MIDINPDINNSSYIVKYRYPDEPEGAKIEKSFRTEDEARVFAARTSRKGIGVTVYGVPDGSSYGTWYHGKQIEY